MADQFLERDGQLLALQMLQELGDWWMDFDPSPDSEDVLPADQDTAARLAVDPAILRRYFATIRSKRSANLERGFMAVLSEYLGSAMNGSPLDIEAYESYVEAA